MFSGTKIIREIANFGCVRGPMIVILYVIATSSPAFSQVSFGSQEELEVAANTLFDSRDYLAAKPLFSQLLSHDPLDPNYNYRFGVCMLFTESDPYKPLPYIEGGANSSDVNPEAYFFLGKAYQLNYRFEDAIAYYEKAKTSGLRNTDLDLDKSVEECRNGMLLYDAKTEFNPVFEKEVITSEFYRPYDFRKLKGKVIPMPRQFMTKYDEKHLKGTLVYTPSNGQTLFYSSYGENGERGKDLFRVNRLPNGEWAIPQRLPTSINTSYDEDHAFFDIESSTLYFSSEGHRSMGGYDIFSSKFDRQSESWSVPYSLRYPINTPYDDFLYLTDPDQQVAFFTSDRNSDVGKLRVFKMALKDLDQPEFTIVEGVFSDETDSVYNYMTATVRDPATGEVIGEYRSHKESGKYLLILPPQNDYTINIGPREADGFKFDLDLPGHKRSTTLKQYISYDATNDQGVITLLNYFDDSGNPDSVQFAIGRPIAEVEERMVAMPDPEALLIVNLDSVLQPDPSKPHEVEEALSPQMVMEDSLKQAEALAMKKEKEEAFRKEFARLEREKQEERRIADSTAAAFRAQEQLKLEELALEKARFDSLAQEELRITKLMEGKARLEKMQLEAAEAKLKASQDSLEQQDPTEQATDLALKELRKDTVPSDTAVTEVIVSDAVTQLPEPLPRPTTEVAVEKTIHEVALADTVSESTIQATSDAGVVGSEPESLDTIAELAIESEAELFLQTLAKLEAQKETQQLLIDQENTELNKERQELTEPTNVVAEEVEDSMIMPYAKVDVMAENNELTAEAVTKGAPTALGMEAMTLKSDADPNAYLMALEEVEAQIEKEAAEVRKDYRLRELETRSDSVDTDAIDPVLKAAIDADRLALEQHQQVAVVKEKALQEEMRRDEDMLQHHMIGFDEELQALEQESSLGNKETALVDSLAAPLELSAEEPPVTDMSKTADPEEGGAEAKEWGIPDTTTMAMNREEAVKETAEEEKLGVEEFKEEILKEIAEVVNATSSEMLATESDVMSDQNDTTEVPIVAEDEAFSVDQNVDLAGPAATNAEAAVEPLDTMETEWEEPIMAIQEGKSAEEASESAMASVPFHQMAAAKRNYNVARPSFDHIEDRQMRRLIKRMRAEDVGRRAVLKNMRNETRDAAGDQDQLNDIAENMRNMEVLANTPSAASNRTATGRSSFNKDDLRKRKDVFYRLKLNIVPDKRVSKTPTDMGRELASAFLETGFDLETGHYMTMADAGTDYYAYRRRGFNNISIIPYLKGKPVRLSEVKDAPFVD